MAIAADETDVPLYIREQVTRIDKMQAELSNILAEQVEVGQDTPLVPVALAFTGAGAGAILFAAGAAFIKLMG